MWKKSEPQSTERQGPTPVGRPIVEPGATRAGAAPPPPGEVTMAAERPGDRAIIGPSITIKGDVTGDEDLVIQGRVEGKVDLAQHNVTVGGNGRIKADVFGRTVTVEGEVEGNLRGEEQIVIRKAGKVKGNIAAPRVTIEDGATFQGSIDMERKPPARPAPAVAAAPAATVHPAPSMPGPTDAGGPRHGEPKRPERSS